MNRYDEDKSAITAALMGLSCDGDCGPLEIGRASCRERV